MNDNAIVNQSYQLIRKDLGLEEEWEVKISINSFDRLLDLLANQIKIMIDQDFNGLINALYKIDIPEDDVKEIFNKSNSLAKDLAKAVINREKQKVVTRLKYRT